VTGRPIAEGDLDAVVALIVVDEEHLNGRPSQVTSGDVRQWMSGIELDRDSWLFEDDDGITGAGWSNVHGELGFGVGIVHPRAKGRGLGTDLVSRSEANVRERGAPRIHQFTIGADAAAHELMLGRDYREVRRFYEMAIHLDARPAASDAAVETLREEDARAFHEALDEAFQDHWEHHSLSFEEWWERHSSNPGFDLSLWFLIRDGDEVAAVVRNDANRNGGGYVGALGVRRAWRGRGYARALLMHTFREFYDRGMPRVTLGVDAESPTGATKLYESVGMEVEQENVVFEKALS
jgi:GNAT superfamily N-acetyltransferase